MSLVENVRGITFHQEVVTFKNGRRLGKLEVDSDGYYQRVPIGALGIATENMTYYKVEDFRRQITDPNTFFNKMLTDGKLYGEYGHPKLDGMEHEAALRRLATIDEKSLSHHFKSVGTGDTLENGGVLLVAALKPHGPYAESLRNSLEDRVVNTSFSLRGISDNVFVNGLNHRSLKKLITFDSVYAGGYNAASKRYAGATENFSSTNIKIDPYKDRLVLSSISVECFSNTELNEIFGTKVIVIANEAVTFIPDTHGILTKSSAHVEDIYQSIIRG